LVSILLYEAGFEKYIELLSLKATPVPPIPMLLKEPAGSRIPRLNREIGELINFCPEELKGKEIKMIKRIAASLFCIVLQNII
jgi:hypothetical protein